MEGFLKVLLVVGVIVWGLLMWEKSQPDPVATYNEAGEYIGNAEVDDRCKEFRKPIDAEDGWSLGYGGRVKQFVSGCL